MPRGQQTVPGTSTPPHSSSNTINDVVNALSQKLTPAVNVKPLPSSRRSSFSMDNILHPGKKDKKRDESNERETRKDKRISLNMAKGSKSKDKHHATTSPRAVAHKPARFEMLVESAPLVLIGNTNSSSGALFSGQLKLHVEDPSGSVRINEMNMVLRATITTQKPISKECKQCISRYDEMKVWNIIKEPKTLHKTENNVFPVSFLFQGHLPGTTEAQLGSLTYAFFVHATTATGETIDFVHPVKIQRAIPPGPDRSSIRIFPPTNLTGRVQLPPVFHRIGTFPVKMVLAGVVEKRNDTQTRWRLRKMIWRIEEQCKVISTPCAKHAHKVNDGKAIQHADSRQLAGDEMKSGWKTDFDTAGGEISLEFEVSLATRSQHKAVCDMESKSGLEVKHILVIELIVAEEFCPNRNSNLITPTGAARVLRMQFNLNVTERAGMGISWDEEMPPMYEDVPPSPPGYGNASKNSGEHARDLATMEDYFGPTIVPLDLERLPSTTADGLPHYREVDPREVSYGLPMRLRRTSQSTQSTHSSEEPESSNRTRYTALQMDDLEHETAEEAYRRRRLEQSESSAQAEDDVGVGSAGAAAQE